MGRIKSRRVKDLGPGRERMKTNLRHGHKTQYHESSTYTSWRGMRDRCRRHPSYKHVSVCERWDDFNNFLEDMGERPEGMTLDRWPDGRGNYEPGNCRWQERRDNCGRRAR